MIRNLGAKGHNKNAVRYCFRTNNVRRPPFDIIATLFHPIPDES